MACRTSTRTYVRAMYEAGLTDDDWHSWMPNRRYRHSARAAASASLSSIPAAGRQLATRAARAQSALSFLFEDGVGRGNAAGRLAIELLFQVSIDCEQVFSGLRQEYGVSYDRIVETAKLQMISKMWHCIQPYLASRRAHSVS